MTDFFFLFVVRFFRKIVSTYFEKLSMKCLPIRYRARGHNDNTGCRCVNAELFARTLLTAKRAATNTRARPQRTDRRRFSATRYRHGAGPHNINGGTRFPTIADRAQEIVSSPQNNLPHRLPTTVGSSVHQV